MQCLTVQEWTSWLTVLATVNGVVHWTRVNAVSLYYTEAERLLNKSCEVNWCWQCVLGRTGQKSTQSFWTRLNEVTYSTVHAGLSSQEWVQCCVLQHKSKGCGSFSDQDWTTGKKGPSVTYLLDKSAGNVYISFWSYLPTKLRCRCLLDKCPVSPWTIVQTSLLPGFFCVS
jgi:hypothetical protein